MTPSLGAIPLFVRDNPCAGAAFELVQPARKSILIEVDGWQIATEAKSSIVVARGGTANGYETALDSALFHAQQGLDLISFTSANHLLIKSHESDRIIWWNDGSNTTARITSTARMSVEIDATLTVIQADGAERKSVTPSYMWHESYRYLRLSQTTDDLFDAYRNAYLALESILSYIAPQKLKPSGKVAEGEGEWLKRALTLAAIHVDLATIAPPPIIDPVSHLFEELYIRVRCRLSHAKSGRQTLLPLDSTELKGITESLHMLTALYRVLAGTALGIRYSIGTRLSRLAAGSALAAVMNGVEMYVSDDNAPFEKDATDLNPNGGLLINLPSDPESDVNSGHYALRRWKAPVASFPENLVVRRIAGSKNGHAALITVLPAPLHLRGFDILEVELGARIGGADQLRQHYSY